MIMAAIAGGTVILLLLVIGVFIATWLLITKRDRAAAKNSAESIALSTAMENASHAEVETIYDNPCHIEMVTAPTPKRRSARQTAAHRAEGTTIEMATAPASGAVLGASIANTTATRRAEGTTRRQRKLPEDWELRDHDGRAYYYNIVTNKSSCHFQPSPKSQCAGRRTVTCTRKQTLRRTRTSTPR